MRRIIAAGLVAAALVVGAVGCSNSVSQEEFTKELVDSGIPQDLAQCVTDGLAAKGFQFRKFGELSAEEEAQVTDVSAECALKGTGLTVPSTDTEG